MKYLKSYKILRYSPYPSKLYEAFDLPHKSDVDKLKQLLRDIFMELSDSGFTIRIEYFKNTEYLSINIIKDKYFIEDVYDTILTARSHMEEHNYYLADMQGSNGQGEYWNLFYRLSMDDNESVYKDCRKPFSKSISRITLIFIP